MSWLTTNNTTRENQELKHTKRKKLFFFQNVQKESKLKCKEQEGDMKKHEAYHGEKVDPSDYKGACSHTHFPFCL